MLPLIFAHAGEEHESVIEAANHALAWYIQIPLFFITLFVVTTLLWTITKKQDTTMLIVATILLISGFGLFQLAPIISVLSITLGLVATLLATLIGLSSNGNKPTK